MCLEFIQGLCHKYIEQVTSIANPAKRKLFYGLIEIKDILLFDLYRTYIGVSIYSME